MSPRNRHIRAATGLKPLDIVLVILTAAAAVASGIAIYGNRKDTVHLVIESPSGSWIYSLDSDRRVEIPGPIGSTTVAIEDGKARIAASPCPNQTCVAAQGISRKGEWNACLPNEVIIRVDGDGHDPAALDATGY
jgi:hypothetical protein